MTRIRQYRPGRAQQLMVFEELDKCNTGRLMKADLESACLALGLGGVEAGARLFDWWVHL